MKCLQTNADFVELATQLLGQPVQSVELRATGANSRVYRVNAGPKTAALKLYPPADAGGLQRLQREFASLTFLATTPASVFVPQALKKSEPLLAGLYEWVDGHAVVEHGATDIAAVAEFLAALQRAGARALEAGIQNAAEAVFSFQEAFEILEQRLDVLRAQEGRHPELIPVLERLKGLLKIMREVCERRPDFAVTLAQEHRTLSPSDFSFHNAMRTPAGSLKFIDYEHFGFDDPAKLCSDFLWHPAHTLSHDERAQFIATAASLFGGEGFIDRWRAMFGIFGLKWVLIILNDFVPGSAQRRRFSEPGADAALRRASQLRKANGLLDDVERRSMLEVK